MRQIFKRNLTKIIVWLSVVAVITSACFILVGYFSADKIKSLITGELNKHLLVETNISAINISMFRSFPDASVVLRDVTMKSPTNLSDAPGLISAERIDLNFNLINLLTGNYKIRSINIENARVELFTDATGANNYRIWKQVPGSSTGAVNFDFSRITLKSSVLSYFDSSRGNDVIVNIDNSVIKGSLLSENIKLKFKGDIYCQQLIIGKQNILPPAAASIETVLDINTSVELLNFHEAFLSYGGVPVEFQGKYYYGDKPIIDLMITSLKAEVSQINTLLPPSVQKEIFDYKPAGKLSLKGTLKGPADDWRTIRTSLSFILDDGHLSYPLKPFEIKSLAAGGTFYYGGAPGTEMLNVNTFRGTLKTGKLQGKLTTRRFKDPLVTLTIKLNANLTELSPLIQNSDFTEFNGNVSADINLEDYALNSAVSTMKMSGNASFADAGFLYKMNKISNLNGGLSLKNQRILCDGLTCTIGKSDFEANGYLDGLATTSDNKSHPVYASLNLNSDKLILEDILALVKKQNGSNTDTGLFPPDISFDISLNVGSLIHKNLITQNINGRFQLSQNVLRGTDVMISAFGGKISASGIINGRYGNKTRIITTASLMNVDINQLFYQFNDFGQKGIVSNNLKGTANAKVDFATYLKPDYTVDIKSVEAIAEIEIRNGELNEFQPLQALSRFLDASELKNVKFATLTNQIEIMHETVVIPRMEINSSVLNLEGYGTHTFGNDIDYHTNMLLSDVIKSGKKKRIVSDEYIEDDGLGKPRLFLKFSGPISDPVVQYDTRAVKKKITDDLRNEKQVLRETFQQEFGIKKPSEQTTVSKKSSKDQPAFRIEWDETK